MTTQFLAAVECYKILVVEDDDGFAMLYDRFLKSTERRNYEIKRTTTAAQGIAACLEYDFDCLIVDYFLPDTSGTVMLNTLRSQLGENTPPAIVLTSNDSGQAVIDALRAEAEDFLPKRSLGALSLCKAIDHVTSRATLKRAVQERNKKLENAYNDLRQKTDELTRFYHTVSHEVKTPLAAITEFVALIKDEIPGPINDEQNVMLTYTQECCEQISRHFNDLLDITRLETGKLVLHKKPQSLAYIVIRCVEGAKGLARDRQIDLSVQCAADLPDICIDSGRISQIISNLITNAIKFTEPEGSIRVELKQNAADHTLVVTVTDNGCGIDKSDLEKVFERLYQVDIGEKNSAKSEGLGLGLPIALDTAKQHGGDIALTSTLGVGSTFSLTLPINETIDPIVPPVN